MGDNDNDNEKRELRRADQTSSNWPSRFSFLAVVVVIVARSWMPNSTPLTWRVAGLSVTLPLRFPPRFLQAMIRLMILILPALLLWTEPLQAQQDEVGPPPFEVAVVPELGVMSRHNATAVIGLRIQAVRHGQAGFEGAIFLPTGGFGFALLDASVNYGASPGKAILLPHFGLSLSTLESLAGTVGLGLGAPLGERTILRFDYTFRLRLKNAPDETQWTATIGVGFVL
jgi:hypothetical protein